MSPLATFAAISVILASGPDGDAPPPNKPSAPSAVPQTASSPPASSSPPARPTRSYLDLAAAAPSDAGSTPRGGDGEARTRLAVMALSADGVPEEYAVGLTESIATRASETGVFETISPKQIASLLAYEKRKELLGACDQESCYVQVAEAVKADHLLVGSVALVAEELVLNLALVDAHDGRTLKRAKRDTRDASELMSEAGRAAIVALQPVLNARRGFMKVSTNVPDAAIIVDDVRQPEAVGQVITVSAGPHVVRVVRDGFYGATADVFVRPGRISEESVTLIPAKETIERYESKAKMMRTGAYAASALAVGAAVTSAIFYARAGDDKEQVDRYANALDVERASGTVGTYDEVRRAEDRFSTHQALYVTGLATALVSGAAAIYLFLAGDDPDRYAEFHGVAR